MLADKKDLPLTLFCEDFGDIGTCCSGLCHENRTRLITVHPESCYSVPYQDKMPDLSLGLSAEICCGRYEAVRRLDRKWWLQLYGKKHGWSEADIELLTSAIPERFYKVWGEIRDRLYVNNRPVYTGRSSGSYSRGVGSPRRVASISKCPSCGQKWNGEVCDNCGHGAGI